MSTVGIRTTGHGGAPMTYINDHRPARVLLGWDTQDPHNAGWAAFVLDAEGQPLDWSESVTFPVDVDAFDRDDWADLVEALEEAFPGATVEVRRQ